MLGTCARFRQAEVGGRPNYKPVLARPCLGDIIWPIGGGQVAVEAGHCRTLCFLAFSVFSGKQWRPTLLGTLLAGEPWHKPFRQKQFMSQCGLRKSNEIKRSNEWRNQKRGLKGTNDFWLIRVVREWIRVYPPILNAREFQRQEQTSSKKANFGV